MHAWNAKTNTCMFTATYPKFIRGKVRHKNEGTTEKEKGIGEMWCM